MIENIKRDGELVMIHTDNKNVPIVRGFTNSWITLESTTIHDTYFIMQQDSDTFSFNYNDITDLIEMLMHVKLSLRSAFDEEKSKDE